MEKNSPTLSAIIIGVKNITQSKDFYVSVFDLTINEISENYMSGQLTDGTLIELEEDSINRFPNWSKNNIGTYKNSEFKVKNLSSFLEKVKKNGGEILSEPIKRPWGIYTAEITDIDGNIFLIAEK